MSIRDRLHIDFSVAEELGYNPYYLSSENHHSGSFKIEDKEYVDFASNDYLGLSTNAAVIESAKKSLEKYGSSLCGTPIATGFTSGLRDLAQRLATFTGTKSALIFPSCYQANSSLFKTIARKDDVILIDHYAHASLIEGVQGVGCKVKPFLHNNMIHLEKLLKKSSGNGEIFIVTESVFSTEGSIAPADQIVELARKYNALPVIDDSHGIGVLGKNGGGILEHFAIDDYNGIYTASLGKALANSGGMIAASEEIITGLSYSLPGLIYSTALTPPAVGGLNGVLDVISCDYSEIYSRLEANQRIIEKALIEKGFELMQSQSAIISIKCGSKIDTIALAKKFFDLGILTTPFVEPSVPKDKGVVRIITGAGVSPKKCEEVAQMIRYHF